MAESPNSALASAIIQFNEQDFFACHDTLEALWIEAATVDKKFYQGLLQVAVAYYHLSNSNWRGALVLLGEGRFRLLAYEPNYAGVDVEKLRQDTQSLLVDLQTTELQNVHVLVAELASQQRSYPQIHNI